MKGDCPFKGKVLFFCSNQLTCTKAVLFFFFFSTFCFSASPNTAWSRLFARIFKTIFLKRYPIFWGIFYQNILNPSSFCLFEMHLPRGKQSLMKTECMWGNFGWFIISLKVYVKLWQELIYRFVNLLGKGTSFFNIDAFLV